MNSRPDRAPSAAGSATRSIDRIMDLDRSIIIAFLAGEATEAERAALEEWRRVDPAHENEFQRRAAIWSLLGETESAAEPAPGIGSESSKVLPLEPAVDRPGRRRMSAGIARAAAVGAFVLAAGLLWSLAANTPAAALEFVTGANEILTEILPDGSVVRLGPSSRLTFEAEDGRRDVQLEGRAFFAVPAADQPFRVFGRGGEVTVVGTRFEFLASASEVRVLVLEGVVALGDARRKVDISANEMGTVTQGAAVRVQPVADVFEATRWVGSFLAFETTPLSEVVRELNARFDTRIEIADPVLASRTLTGSFESQETGAIVANVCVAVDARCIEIEGTIRMEAASPPPLVGSP